MCLGLSALAQCSTCTHCIHCYSFCLLSHMLFQLFRDSNCLAETKIGWMDSFAKLLNEDCVWMFFILMTSRVMLTPNYFARRQNKDIVCTHCCPETQKTVVLPQKSRTQLHIATYLIFTIQNLVCKQMFICYDLTIVSWLYVWQSTYFLMYYSCILFLLYCILLFICVRLTRGLINAT